VRLTLAPPLPISRPCPDRSGHGTPSRSAPYEWTGRVS